MDNFQQEKITMYYIYIFKPVPDTNLVTVECFNKSFVSFNRAKKILDKAEEGYIIKYPSSRPICSKLKEVR